jgi:hypothetical protein
MSEYKKALLSWKKLLIFATILPFQIILTWLIRIRILALYNYFKMVKYLNVFFFYERAPHIAQSTLLRMIILFDSLMKKALIKSLNF